MFSFKISLSNSVRKHVQPLTVALLWLSGLLFGYLISNLQTDFLSSMMRTACNTRVSILGLSVVLFLPFLIIFLSYAISAPILTLPFIFLKALLFSCCSIGITRSFYDAAWLIRFFLLFSDSIGVVILMLYSLRYCQCNCSAGFKRESVLFALILLLAGCIDYMFISPFLVRFMYHF